MYSQPNAAAAMAPPQKPETFMLSDAAQQSLPHDAQVALQQVDNLKYFLISAPVDWSPDQYIRRFLLPTGEYVSCVLWNNLFHISGTDIVRCLSFRFQAFGRPVKNSKKFEEGIFSDLRNLKAGTDASLEEPKSPFLDFMYKNNCIRTQKKQKVFYWYSVPHDRLFLDALERDLKREKMGQEATTVAVSEPALSFEFDSSQSLFEQLTKAQQANTSSFSANAGSSFSQSTSPVLRATDSMPPPSLPQALPTVAEDMPTSMGSYQHAAAMHQAQAPNVVKREAEYGQVQYDRNGIPLSRVHQRHTSMPTYMEYSPAPSFVSSQGEYGAYSNRDMSFEPVTPPQNNHGVSAEPAYIGHEETGLFSNMGEVQSAQSYNSMMQMPANNMSGGQYGASRGSYGGNVYSVIEGSPTYKQRRRRSSIPPNVAQAIQNTQNNGMQHAPHRQSDLRRSVSVTIDDANDSGRNSPPPLPNGYANMVAQHKEMLDHMSRHGTPLQTLEGSPAPPNVGMMQSQEAYHGYDGGMPTHSPADTSPSSARAGDRPGPVRRARSATMMELGPYPHKNHSCPIPTCGRLFKRLEHLKRHVRTHTQERPYVCPHCNKAFSRSDNLAQHRRTHEARPDGETGGYTDEDLEAEENEFGTLDDEESDSPLGGSHHPGGPTSDDGSGGAVVSATSSHHTPQSASQGQFSMSAGLAGHGAMGPPPPMMGGQMLSQQI